MVVRDSIVTELGTCGSLHACTELSAGYFSDQDALKLKAFWGTSTVYHVTATLDVWGSGSEMDPG